MGKQLLFKDISKIKTNSQTDQVIWVDQCHLKVKSCAKATTKIKVSFAKKKVLHFRVSAVY